MVEQGAPGPRRFDAAVIGGDSGVAATAVAAAGGRVAYRLAWGERLGMGGTPVLVVEAEGAGEEELAEALPEIARFARERGCRVVAAFGVEELDMVAASLMGRDVELLCEPGLPERIAALIRAAQACDEPPGTVREDGTEAGGAAPFGLEPPEGAPADAAEIRAAIRARRMRDGFFMPGLFSDPAWDMLLDLYAAELEELPVSVSSLCIAAAAPTTALRWIARLTEDGLLERRPDASDRRRAFMGLTEVARVGMMGYIAAVKRAGLWIA